MCGKTATSQVRRISMKEREEGIIKNEDLPRNQRDHALFVGYYPHLKPKYGFSVVVEHGGSGSKSAAPIAKDLCNGLNLIDIMINLVNNNIIKNFFIKINWIVYFFLSLLAFTGG